MIQPNPLSTTHEAYPGARAQLEEANRRAAEEPASVPENKPPPIRISMGGVYGGVLLANLTTALIAAILYMLVR